jgi:hypothetical protein
MDNRDSGSSTFNNLIHIGVVVRDMGEKTIQKLTAHGNRTIYTENPTVDARGTFRGKAVLSCQRVEIQITRIGNMNSN